MRPDTNFSACEAESPPESNTASRTNADSAFDFNGQGIAYCGLACCVCSENGHCPGCQSGGCNIHGWCKNYQCCQEKGLSGCWECADFPCEGGMLDKPRVRAFAKFAKKFDTDELVRCLMRNKANGILYHYEGQLVGDYDKGRTEDEIIEIIKNGLETVN